MATVYFYEKTGCINNTRQKALLIAAGHEVIAKNLLIEPWAKVRLRAFFGTRPVSEWFNYSAPAIKHGEVHPKKLDKEQALDLMLQQPLLIRRPLMQVGNECRAGFDTKAVDEWIGLTAVESDKDLETCPRNSHDSECASYE